MSPLVKQTQTKPNNRVGTKQSAIANCWQWFRQVRIRKVYMESVRRHIE
ncbi:hypothetical protein [Pseudanabaena cinerea]|nr:hypothetical protein [Pseudanabaena cinerea]